jgi:hypothetical protein
MTNSEISAIVKNLKRRCSKPKPIVSLCIYPRVIAWRRSWSVVCQSQCLRKWRKSRGSNCFQTFYEKNNIWKLIKQLRILDLKLKIISSHGNCFISISWFSWIYSFLLLVLWLFYRITSRVIKHDSRKGKFKEGWRIYFILVHYNYFFSSICSILFM